MDRTDAQTAKNPPTPPKHKLQIPKLPHPTETTETTERVPFSVSAQRVRPQCRLSSVEKTETTTTERAERYVSLVDKYGQPELHMFRALISSGWNAR